MNRRVAVGLSGGVDSSVAAAILLKRGYEVSGVYLECYNEPGCRTDQDKKDALRVALQLGIPFQVVDFRLEYRERVIEYFYREYQAGRTPNPDIVCNREIKFGIFYAWARAQGFDYVATGHYARVGRGKLRMAKDKSKDQSYFLWQVPQDYLEHILFPLGSKLKSEVRAQARELRLATAEKPDSMGICFIGEVDVAQLLKDRLGEKSGAVRWRGEKIGEHRGLWFYTIGQRGGWRLWPEKQHTQTPVLYVTGKNVRKNELLVGERAETVTSEVRVRGRIDLRRVGRLWVRVRNLGELYEIERIKGEVVYTKEPIFGVAGGQSAVFYDSRGVVVGGGIIESRQTLAFANPMWST